MGTTQKTQQTDQFNQAGLGAYNQMAPAFGQQATNFINSPYGNPQFQFEQQLGTRNAMGQNQTNLSNLTRNATAMGMGGTNNPAFMEMLNNMMRGNTANTALQGFINPTQLANQRQQASMQMASQFKPLQTGGTQVQSTGGLGTWLPQVAGMALGAATGGLSGLAGGAGSFFGGAGAHPSGGGFNPGLMNNPMGGMSDPSSMGGVPGMGGGSSWFGPQMGQGWGGAGATPGIAPGQGGGMMPWMGGGYGG